MTAYKRAIKLSHDRVLQAERRAWLALTGMLAMSVATGTLAYHAVNSASIRPAPVPIYVELAENGQLLRASELSESFQQIPTSAIKARLIEWVIRFRRRPADPVLATRDIEWALGLTGTTVSSLLSKRLAEIRPIDAIKAGLRVEVIPLTAFEREPGHWELTWQERRHEDGMEASEMNYRGLISIELMAVPVSVERPFGELIVYVDYAPLAAGDGS